MAPVGAALDRAVLLYWEEFHCLKGKLYPWLALPPDPSNVFFFIPHFFVFIFQEATFQEVSSKSSACIYCIRGRSMYMSS
jgi:hypothetical protein